MDSQFEALAAWVDGEPVSRTDVAGALETSEGRDYVLDLMALRRMVSQTTPSLVTPSGTRTRRQWPMIAAAAAIVIAAGGFAAGRFLTPASPAVTVDTAPVATPASMSAPAPTRVIQLEESANWRESGGS